MLTNISDTCLLGIVLTVTSHSGPQLVYHYPPSAKKYESVHSNKKSNKDNKKSQGDHSATSGSDDYDNDEYDDDDDNDDDDIYSDEGDFDDYSNDDRATYPDTDYNDSTDISTIKSSTEQSYYDGGSKVISPTSNPSSVIPHSLISEYANSRNNNFNLSGTMNNNSNTNLQESLLRTDTHMSNQDHHQLLIRKQTRNSVTEAHDSDNVENTNEYENTFDDSGLSDSELSTDYANYSDSSDSSDSFSSASSTTSTTSISSSSSSSSSRVGLSSTPNKTLLTSNTLDSHSSSSKPAQVSAKKIFQVLNEPDTASTATTTANTITSSRQRRKKNQSNFATLPQQTKDCINLINKNFPKKEYSIDSKIQNYDPEFLAEFCSPPKELCNTRFEFTADELCFLGLPIHINEDGTWGKTKNKKKGKKQKRSSKKQNIDDRESKEISGNTKNSLEENALSLGITMFNLVFIMNPQLTEFDERTDDMYHYIITRYSLFLRYLQAKSNFISKEAFEILKIKEKYLNCNNQFLYKKILAKSSLARSITQCFEKVSDKKIANLIIDDDKFLSLQIPIKNEFANFPNYKIDPVLNGSYLTSILNKSFLHQNLSESANFNNGAMASGLLLQPSDEQDAGDMSMGDDLNTSSLDLLNHAILFIKEPSDIIAELNATSGEDDLRTVIMISLVKNLKPTLPLRAYKHIIANIISSATDEDETVDDGFLSPKFCLNMLKSFALHFMYWRQARAIIPLSSKNTYIVSPLAPIRGFSSDDFDPNIEYEHLGTPPLIYQYSEKFREKFPTLPKLSAFLSLISNSGSGAKPFGVFIPSADHKHVYLTALSWLLRKGYVTQLLTFVHLRVDKKIKISVEEDLEREGLLKNKKKKTNTAALKRKNLKSEYTGDLGDENRQGSSGSREQTDEDSDNRSLFSLESDVDRDDYTIILDPRIATAIEKRWLYKCVEGLSQSQQILFHKLLKYFNGRIPIEYLIIKENISRQDINKLFASLGNYLVELKYW